MKPRQRFCGGLHQRAGEDGVRRGAGELGRALPVEGFEGQLSTFSGLKKAASV